MGSGSCVFVNKFSAIKTKKELFKSGDLSIIKIVESLKANAIIGEEVEILPGLYFAKSMLIQAGKRDVNSILIDDTTLGIPYIEETRFNSLLEQGKVLYVN